MTERLKENLILLLWGAMGGGFVAALLLADALHSVPQV
jgi:hypothetical protein